MKRQQLIQHIFNSGKFKTYLEIGCYKGNAFFPLKAERKIAVDPKFHPLFYINYLKTVFSTSYKSKNHLFKLTSDDFFKKQQRFLKRKSPIDVVLIDGLHTFETSLNDVLNALPFLNKNGVIIMHDCLPPNEAAALPTKAFPKDGDLKNITGWTGAWCGDVWKTIVYLNRAYGNQLDVYVIDTDNGLGIVKFKSNTAILNYTVNQSLYNEIDSKTFNDLMRFKYEFLNLKPKNYTNELIQEFNDLSIKDEF